MPRTTRHLTTDDGIFAYRTRDHQQRYGVRLRVHGRLWQRQGFTSKLAAQRVRDKIRLEAFEGIFFPDKYQRQRAAGLTVADCCRYVEADYARHQRKSGHSALSLSQFWQRTAGADPVDRLTATRLTTWADRWLAAGTSTATINRRMTFLRRGLVLANLHGAGLTLPHWTRLREQPPRSGFLDWPTFQRIRRALPAYAQIPVTIGFWTGMRWGEIVSLRPAQLHFDHAAQHVKLSLDPLDTKTHSPRIVIMPGDLYHVLTTWRAAHPTAAWVCHRDGARLQTLDAVWKSACVKIGLATRAPNMREYRGPHLHDLRRSGVRNLVQAGVPEKVAMQISGHKTRSVFDRYHIVIESDLADAGRHVVAYCQALDKSASMTSSMTAPDSRPKETS